MTLSPFRIKLLILLSLVLIVFAFLILTYKNIRNINDSSISKSGLVDIKTLPNNLEIKTKNLRAFFLIRLANFDCQACFQSFLKVSYYINDHRVYYKDSVIYFFEKDERDFEVLQRVVNRMCILNSISFPAYIIPRINTYISENRNCVFISNGDKYEIFYFPIYDDKLEHAMNLLK